MAKEVDVVLLKDGGTSAKAFNLSISRPLVKEIVPGGITNFQPGVL